MRRRLVDEVVVLGSTDVDVIITTRTEMISEIKQNK